MKENFYDPEENITIDKEDLNTLRLDSFHGQFDDDGGEFISKDTIITRLIMLLDAIEELDLDVKEDHKYFRDETRRMMEGELSYLRGKKICNYMPPSDDIEDNDNVYEEDK